MASYENGTEGDGRIGGDGWRDGVVREDFGGEMEFSDRGEHGQTAFWGR